MPRYHVGKTVYIKEAFTYVTLAEKDPWKDQAMKDGSFRRKPDGSPVTMCYKLDGYEIGSDWLNPRGMPAWAARYFIKITKVEACRTKDITWTDCVDEGIKAFGKDGNVAGRGYWSWDGDLMFHTPQLAYFALYDSINGTGAHERNWDWKYSFIPHSP